MDSMVQTFKDAKAPFGSSERVLMLK